MGGQSSYRLYMGDAPTSGSKAWNNIAFTRYSLEDEHPRVGWKNNASGLLCYSACSASYSVLQLAMA